ncbi:MAG: ROK family transcriptional regulator [Solobacterium sp.]|nr:ROK family transcriptional regulator [Solobacterium sp.]
MAGRENGKNQISAKKENVALIKSLIYREGPISRAQIAEHLSLTPPTITNIIGEMIEDGIVCEIREASSEKERKVGRQPINIDFVTDARFVLGISLGRDFTHYCVCDLRGNVLLQGKAPVMPDDYEEMLKELCGIIDRIRENDPARWGKMIGIGVALPGIVNAHTGIVLQTDAVRENWKGKPLADTLSDIYRMPVRVENNVRARTYALSLFRPEIISDFDTFVLCFASWGIACPIILKNRSVRGEEGTAGEIGHMIMDPDAQDGTLENYASLRSVIRKCEQAMAEGRAGILKELCGDQKPDITMITDAQAKGDPDIIDIMYTAMRYIGIALSNIISFMNPDLIVLSGPMFMLEDNLILAEETMRKYAYAADITHTVVKYVPSGEYDGAMAAAAACLDKYFVRD